MINFPSGSLTIIMSVIPFSCDFGRFAAALIDYGIDCWVMNVVPVSGPNALPVIYDRGLIGVVHDWYVLVSVITAV